MTRGLRGYRLFPGDLERPAFVNAAANVRAAAEHLTLSGPAEIDLRAGRFHGPDGPLDRDDLHGVLARILFGHGVERMLVTRPPSPEDLALFYRELTDVDAAADAPLGERLQAAGLESIIVGEMAPLARMVEEGERGEPRATDLDEGGLLAGALLARDAPDAGPESRAQAILEHLRELLRDEASAATTVRTVSRLRRALTELPPEVREAFYNVVLRGSDETAETVRASMTDAELAEVLAGVAAVADGDPLAMARELVDRGERHDVIVALTRNAMQDDADGDVLIAETGSPGQASHAEALIATGLAEGKTITAEVAEAFAISDREAVRVARQALRDYLLLATDERRLRTALSAWGAEVRTALAAGELEDAQDLAEIVGSVTPEVGSRAAPLIDEARDLALEAESLVALLPTDPSEDLRPLGSLLRPFGGAAVDRLFALLAAEKDRTRRGRLIELLGLIAEDGVDRIDRWLGDTRWYVVRNAVHVLAVTNHPHAPEMLRRVVAHPEHRVRREAIRGLVTREGTGYLDELRSLATRRAPDVAIDAVHGIEMIVASSAAEALATIATDPTVDPSVSEAALRGLGTHPDPVSASWLKQLSSRGGGLPWKLRRTARQVSAKRGGR